MSKMNPEVKAKWVAALRSGKYEQGQGILKDDKGKFCCLGVLCDISGLGEWDAEGVYRHSAPDRRGIFLITTPIQEWAALEDKDPHIGMYSASEWNDREGMSFTQIADLIEEHL